MNKVSVILLAGGNGLRMQTKEPKQYLPLLDKPIVHHSLEFFLSLDETFEIIIVANPLYYSLFAKIIEKSVIPIKFALPGKRRQDSVYNGLQQVDEKSSFVCIHDAARPFLLKDSITNLFKEAFVHKAATLAVPLKFTVKQGGSGFVQATLNREALYEIQTPQVIEKKILQKGFDLAIEQNLTVTDDVSLVELLKLPVKLVEGSYMNIKITTPEDLLLAPYLYKKHHETA